MMARDMPFRRMTASVVVAICALAILLIGPIPAFAVGEPGADPKEKPRVAFVIGNAAYSSITALRNPINDGKLIAGTLKRLHFTVVEGYDMSLTDMYKMFNDNKPLIDNAEAVVVYYAGHGFQLGGSNYLVPVDATFGNAAQIADETVTLDGLIKLLESPDRPLFLFLDACRNNPLALDNAANGLAQVNGGTNTFVAFSTSPGSTTKDGREANSPFALALAQNLEVPGLSILNLDIAVRERTLALTLNQQQPWSQQSLLTDFFFAERQTLDPNALLLAVSTIMSNGTDSQKDEFRTDMAVLGLQGAVMRAQQREVILQGLDLYSPPPAPETKVASASEAATLELASGTVPTAPAAPGTTPEVIGTLLFAARNPDAKGDVEGAIDEAVLKRQLQTELRRLGCYNAAIDGDWGPGSKAALKRFLEAKGLPVGELGASVPMLDRTAIESGRVCRAPVQVRPADKGLAAGKTKTQKAIVKAPTKQRTATKPTKPQRQMTTVQSFRRPVAKGNSAPARAERSERRQEVRRQMGAGFGIGGY